MGWVKAINTEFNMRKWVSLQGTATINKFFTYTGLHHNSSKRNLYASRNKFVRGQYRMKYFSFYIFIYSRCALWQATCNPIHLRRHLYYLICTYEYYCKFKKQDCTNFYFLVGLSGRFTFFVQRRKIPICLKYFIFECLCRTSMSIRVNA